MGSSVREPWGVVLEISVGDQYWGSVLGSSVVPNTNRLLVYVKLGMVYLTYATD